MARPSLTYDYDIELRRSSDNGNADALLRLPLPDCDSDASDKFVNWTQEATAFNRHQVNSLPVTAKSVTRETLHDAVLARALYYTRNGWPDSEDVAQELKPFHSRQREFSIEKGCLLWGARVVIPSRYRTQILEELHGGHPGIVRMKGLARLYVWWPNIDQDIENTVQGCSACKATQPMPTRAKELMGRQLRTRLDLIYPDASQRIERKASETEKPMRELNIGDVVLRHIDQMRLISNDSQDNKNELLARDFSELISYPDPPLPKEFINTREESGYEVAGAEKNEIPNVEEKEAAAAEKLS
ncbi:uncharacterized protein [Palaemon carinicauda]|uniref:uncharacterized protein n=1 Tax=Palaemon carinicauda TaxID=392227 RepID=UPI0035B62B10